MLLVYCTLKKVLKFTYFCQKKASGGFRAENKKCLLIPHSERTYPHKDLNIRGKKLTGRNTWLLFGLENGDGMGYCLPAVSPTPHLVPALWSGFSVSHSQIGSVPTKNNLIGLTEMLQQLMISKPTLRSYFARNKRLKIWPL